MVLGRISGIIVAGGDGSCSVDFWAGDLGIKKLPNLPQEIAGQSMVLHNGTIIRVAQCAKSLKVPTLS